MFGKWHPGWATPYFTVWTLIKFIAIFGETVQCTLSTDKGNFFLLQREQKDWERGLKTCFRLLTKMKWRRVKQFCLSKDDVMVWDSSNFSFDEYGWCACVSDLTLLWALCTSPPALAEGVSGSWWLAANIWYPHQEKRFGTTSENVFVSYSCWFLWA